jgi:hypothetical protein
MEKKYLGALSSAWRGVFVRQHGGRRGEIFGL